MKNPNGIILNYIVFVIYLRQSGKGTQTFRDFGNSQCFLVYFLRLMHIFPEVYSFDTGFVASGQEAFLSFCTVSQPDTVDILG